MNDVRKVIYGTIIGFFLMLALWFSIIYISSCGFTFTCNRGEQLVERTPIPTLIPASHSESEMVMMEFDKCQVYASDLVGAWASAEYPETDTFSFTDVNGESCEGTYSEDIQHLFIENSLWRSGTLGCTSCHNGDLTERSSGLDLTSYDALMLGSRRVAGSSSAGTDILGDWESSILHEVIVNQGLTPDGHSADASIGNPILPAGRLISSGELPTTP